MLSRKSPDILNVGETQLTPRGATVMGCVFIAVGLLTIWAGLRSPAAAADDVPSWVPLVGGLFFMAGGGAVIVNFGAEGRLGPDGQLSPDTPLFVRMANVALGLAMVGLLGAIFAWIGFGPGDRSFSMTVSTPGSRTPIEDNETIGRAIFGGFAVLLVVVFVAGALKGFRDIRDHDISRRS